MRFFSPIRPCTHRSAYCIFSLLNHRYKLTIKGDCGQLTLDGADKAVLAETEARMTEEQNKQYLDRVVTRGFRNLSNKTVQLIWYYFHHTSQLEARLAPDQGLS